MEEDSWNRIIYEHRPFRDARGYSFENFSELELKEKVDSLIGHNLQRVYRDMRRVKFFPAEALCELLFHTLHFFWRLKYKK